MSSRVCRELIAGVQAPNTAVLWCEKVPKASLSADMPAVSPHSPSVLLGRGFSLPHWSLLSPEMSRGLACLFDAKAASQGCHQLQISLTVTGSVA